MIDDRDLVAQPFDLGQEVRVEQDRGPAVARAPDDGADVGAADGIERGGRLVEHDQARCAQQRDGQPEPLLHALRERPDHVLGSIGEADVLECGAHRRLPARRQQPQVQLDHLASPQPGLVAERLGQVADPPAGHQIAERRAEHRATPTGRAGEPQQQLDRGRLARPVGPEEADDLARLDAHREVDQCDGPTVALGQPVGLDDRRVRVERAHGRCARRYACGVRGVASKVISASNAGWPSM